MNDSPVRTETDAMGSVQVPANAYYGANTKRAVDNFTISDLRLQKVFIKALAMIKKYAAAVNHELGLLDEKTADAVQSSAEEVIAGKFNDQFVVDVFQTGSGTSTNMNMNEVISSRANETLTGKINVKSPIHPNDHVNLGQSSNDVIPSSIHISALIGITEDLLPALSGLQKSLDRKAREFADIKKMGRTHLQDAVPMTLGQTFSGFSKQIELGIKRLDTTSKSLEALALGGTAVGTGINTHKDFSRKVIAHIADQTGLPFYEAENHFEAQSAQDAAVEVSGCLKTIAVSLFKIANDIRLLASGPRCGIGEIMLPSLQPGSSIMPGKVNPVIPEAVIQVAATVIGNDATITVGGYAGYFELNTMLPIIAYNLLESIEILSSACITFSEKCIEGIVADKDVCEGNIEKSLAMATYLVPHIGYDKASAIAKRAYATGKTVREIALDEEKLPSSYLS